MADNSQDNDGPNLAAATVGGLGAFAGAGTVAERLYKDEDMAALQGKAGAKLQEKGAAYAVKEEKVLRNISPADNTLRNAHFNSIGNLNLATTAHERAVTEATRNAINELPAEAHGRLETDALTKKLEHLDTKAGQGGARVWERGATQAELDAVKETAAHPDFAKLSPPDAQTALKQAAADARTEFGATHKLENVAQHEAFVNQHKGTWSKLREESFASNPDVMNHVTERTAQSAEELSAKTAQFNKAKAAWQPREAKLFGKESKQLISARNDLHALENIEKLNAERGTFWGAVKRPFQLMHEGSGGARVKIVAGAVALGTAVWAGTKVLTHKEPEPEPQQRSYAAMIRAQRAAQANSERGV